MSKIVIVMGVSGCGKSTIGEILARDCDGIYFDGDDFHPPANVEKMRQGIPLTDADRVGWMEVLCELIRRRKFARNRTYIACSALRLAFRDGLRTAYSKLGFLFLEGDFDLISGRISAREGHYMPASLLKSQFDALEKPGTDEPFVSVVSIEGKPEAIGKRAVKKLYG
ncbi:MAG: gluconokinase [Verrucomicrobiales bacterium]|jgi:gluconokinase